MDFDLFAITVTSLAREAIRLLGSRHDGVRRGVTVYRRMRDRNISDRSIWYAIKNATRCTPYMPENGPLTDGTAWRITGLDHEREETSVGVEAFVDHLGRRLLIITVF